MNRGTKRPAAAMDTCAASPETTCSDTSSATTSLGDLATAAAAAISTVGLSTMLLMQLDGVSRRFLAPPRLLAKRRQEYKYTLEQSAEYNSLMLRQFVGGGRRAYNPKDDADIWEPYAPNDSQEMDEIVSAILDAKKPTPVIVAIEQDLGDERDPNTHHLFLAFPPEKGDSVETPAQPKFYPRRVRVPLVAFSKKLAAAFEGQMTSTALCFVADASSGLGSEMLTTIVGRCDRGVATISDPAWMASLALLRSQKTHSVTAAQFDRVVFALCRLDAWRVRSSVGKSRTVLFALPGQSCVPLLLPLIQRVFVHERHVFVYDGCCHAVERGLALRKKCGSSYRQTPATEEWEAVSAAPKVISATFPLAPIRHNRELPGTLANLNGVQASIVEAWMASVDAFLEMKAREKKNFYTPFVCRMGFLMKRSGIGNGTGDSSELALKNVLQYITGSKSRALPQVVMEAAQEALAELRTKFEEDVQGCKLTKDTKVGNLGETILVEKCVFTHKSILIGEKTLLDTVQPKEDWSLKAAKKLKSCLCCIPGEGEEEDGSDDEEGVNEDGESTKPKAGIDLSVPGAFATNRPKYVDGKAGFAFDPTAFSK